MKLFNDKISDEDLRSIIHVEKETRSNQYITTCPFCGKPLHFYINRKTQKWDCKKCQLSGGIYKLLRHVDKLYLLGARTVKVSEQLKSIRDSEQGISNAENKENEQLPIVRMPAGFRIFNTCPEYLIERGISMWDVKHWGFGETKIETRYIGYILIPIKDNGEIRGFIGRYANKKIPENKLRYSNSLHTDFASLLFGYDDIIEGKTEVVIITEGLFDAISVTKKLRLFEDFSVRAVCTFGKKISQNQIDKLLVKKIKRVVLLFDYDALKEIRYYSNILNEYFETFVAVSLKKKDIDECTQDEVIEVFNKIRNVKDFRQDIAGKLKR